MRFSPVIQTLVTLLIPITIGLQSRDIAAQTPQDDKVSDTPYVELLHVWRTDSEQAALDVFRQTLKKQGVHWYDEAVFANFVTLRKALSERIAQGIPPSVSQWIIGDHMRDLVDAGEFRNITELSPDLIERLRPEVRDILVHHDGLVAVPLGIHIQNYAIYNKDILRTYGLEAPTTWDQLISYGEILQQDGISLIGHSDQPWQRRQILMAIFASISTREEFERLQNENQPLDGLEHILQRAMEIFYGLARYGASGSDGKPWEDITAMVADGKVLAQFLGDFVVPELPDPERIVCGLPPESNYPLWAMDGFVFIKVEEPELIKGQEVFLQSAFDPETIIRYTIAKGGLPVFSDVPEERLKHCHAASLRTWNTASDRVWTGGVSWHKRLGVLGEFGSDDETLEKLTPDEAAKHLMTLLSSI